MNNPIEFFKSLFKNKKTTLAGNEVIALQYLHPEKGAINTGDYCTTQDIANLATTSLPELPKIYKAILTQTGTNDPVATVLNENDSNYLGNLTWQRYSTGEFGASKNGVSSTNTSFIASSNFGASSSDLITIQVSCSNNVIYFATYVSGIFKDGINQMFVTIEYYGA